MSSTDAHTATTWPTPDRKTVPTVPDGERDSLESWLEYHRTTLLLKCAGLTPEQLVLRSCEPSTLSLLGLVRHMADVEAWLLDFEAAEYGPYYAFDDDRPGWDPHLDDLDPTTAEQDLANYHDAIRRARIAVADVDLDVLSPGDDGTRHSLRWIYQHMIEEYARHNGHADILRERIDGVTGD